MRDQNAGTRMSAWTWTPWPTSSSGCRRPTLWPRRDERAATARRAGERELAAAIKELRRPRVGAWLANLLVRERPDEVSELLAVGTELRQAQAHLAHEDLRRLSKERRRVVASLAADALELARDRGQSVSDAAARELEATLEAAILDAGAAGQLEAGRLTVALGYAGLGWAGADGPLPAEAAVATGGATAEAGVTTEDAVAGHGTGGVGHGRGGTNRGRAGPGGVPGPGAGGTPGAGPPAPTSRRPGAAVGRRPSWRTTRRERVTGGRGPAGGGRAPGPVPSGRARTSPSRRPARLTGLQGKGDGRLDVQPRWSGTPAQGCPRGRPTARSRYSRGQRLRRRHGPGGQ